MASAYRPDLPPPISNTALRTVSKMNLVPCPGLSSAPPDQADEHLTRLIREYSQVAWADKVFGSSYIRKGVRLGPEAAANDCRNPVLWLVRRPQAARWSRKAASPPG
jgi:hypothetical protein